MAHAHAAGLVHRDLKPANILVSADGTPRVVDFGLARVADQPGGPTDTGQLIGTPGYMAPEQCGRPGGGGPPADVFALGAVLHQLLTGRPPFLGGTPVETLFLTLNDAPPPLPRTVPRSLAAVCEKCLEKRPADRYPTAAELADDLDRVLAGKPTVARRPSLVRRYWRSVRRWPTVAVGGLFGLVVIGLVAALVWPDDPAEPPAAPPPPDRPHRLREYAQEVRLATVLVEQGNMPAARTMLDRWLPAPGQEDVRGFEWHLARHRADNPPFQLAAWPVSDKPVYGLAVFPAGDRLAVTAGTEVRVIGAADGRPAGPTFPHPADVSHVAVSADGRAVATATADGAVRVWAADGTLRHTLAAHRGRVGGVAFGGTDAAAVYTAGKEDGAVVRWDLSAAPPVRRNLVAGGPKQHALGILPGGRAVVVADPESGAVVLDSEDGRRLARLPALNRTDDGGRPRAIAVDPSGRVAVTDFTLEWTVWAPEDLTFTRWRPEFRKATPRVLLDIAFVPSGYAVAAVDDTVCIWPGNGAMVPIANFRGHAGRVWAVAGSPDGRRAYSGGQDGTVRMWNPLAPSQLPAAVRQPGTLNEFVPRADGSVLASFAGPPDQIQMWLPSGPDHIYTLATPAFAEPVNTVLPDPAGPGWLAVTKRGALVRWADGGSARPIADLPGLTDRRWRKLSAAPDGRSFVAVPAGGGLVHAWDIPSGTPRPPFGSPTWTDTNVTVSALAGGLVASNERGVGVEVWDAATGARLTPAPLPAADLTPAVAVSPDRKRVAVGDGSVVRVYDLATGAGVAQLVGHTGPVAAVDFAPDGRTLATCGADKTVRLWQAETGAEYHLTLEAWPLTGLRFDPSGRRLWIAAQSPSGDRPEFRLIAWDCGRPLGP